MIRTAQLVLFISIFIGIFFFQTRLTGYAGQKWKCESLTYIPRDERLRSGLLGFETTFSHILWIKTLLYFGGHYLTDKNYPWLVKMIDLITKLNPRFYPAYEFAGVMIPEVCNDINAARVILDRGIFYIGDRKWNLAFYMSMLFYKYYGENEIAAEYMAMAAQVKGAPAVKLAGIAAALYSKAGLSKNAEDFLILMYQVSENPEVRSHLSTKIMEFQNRSRVNYGSGSLNRLSSKVLQ